MIKSVVQLKHVPMPFAIESVLTARVDLPRRPYPDSPASIRFFEQLLPRLRAVPGVEAATLSDGLPAAGNGTIPSRSKARRTRRTATTRWRAKGSSLPGYFDTFQTQGAQRPRIHAPATSRQASRSPSSTSRSRALHFPGSIRSDASSSAIRPGTKEPWLTIVGVVPDLLMEGIGNNNASPIGYYIPIAQSDVANGVRIALRTRGDPAS